MAKPNPSLAPTPTPQSPPLSPRNPHAPSPLLPLGQIHQPTPIRSGPSDLRSDGPESLPQPCSSTHRPQPRAPPRLASHRRWRPATSYAGRPVPDLGGALPEPPLPGHPLPFPFSSLSPSYLMISLSLFLCTGAPWHCRFDLNRPLPYRSTTSLIVSGHSHGFGRLQVISDAASPESRQEHHA